MDGFIALVALLDQVRFVLHLVVGAAEKAHYGLLDITVIIGCLLQGDVPVCKDVF